MKKQFLVGLTAGLFVLCLLEIANATVFTYGDRTVFDAQGTIDYNSNFQDFGTSFSLPGNPFTRGDVTYNSDENLIWGSSTQYTTTENLIGNNYWTPILGDISTVPQYDMFGFDIGTYGSSPITITVYTNIDTYIYSGLSIANSNAGLLDFEGFIASSGEYFTGFKIVADNGVGNLPGITNVTLGHSSTAPVPEPATMLLFGTGLAGLVGTKFRRKKK